MTFHQISAQMNFFPLKKDKLPCYFLDEYEHPNGELKTAKLYDHNQLIEEAEYYENGELKEEFTYENGLFDGYYSFSTKSEDSTVNGYYKQGKKHGKWRESVEIKNHQDECKIVVSHYENDLLHGKYMLKDDKKKVIGYYEKGQKTGKWIEYNGYKPHRHADQVIATFAEDLLEGSYIRKENKKIILSGQYVRGKKHGDWLFYDKEGKHIKTEKYSEGALIECLYP
jgi:antitoxin component YwqK of YwqJK toxin-antitoxin module